MNFIYFIIRNKDNNDSNNLSNKSTKDKNFSNDDFKKLFKKK